MPGPRVVQGGDETRICRWIYRSLSLIFTKSISNRLPIGTESKSSVLQHAFIP